jgi:transketolase
MAVIQPGDAVETERALEYIVAHKGPVFLRLTRQKVEDINPPDYRFQFGKGVTLRDGGDLTIMGTGGVLGHAIKAAERLAKKGIEAGVVNIHTLKPLDRDLIAELVVRHGRIVTVEDHGLVGGLGSAVAEVVVEIGRGQVGRLAVNDYAESGDSDGLYKKYGLSEEHIEAKALELLQD